jgi:hypothetical protein
MASSGPFLSRSTRPTLSSPAPASVEPVGGGVASFPVAAFPSPPGTVVSSCAALFLRADGLHAGEPMQYDAGSHRSAHNRHLGTRAERSVARCPSAPHR